jgi:hypothetical protein
MSVQVLKPIATVPPLASWFGLMNADQPSFGESNAELSPKLPPIGEQVLVRCERFRCLAYRDAEGNWRDAYNSDILPDVIEVLPSY